MYVGRVGLDPEVAVVDKNTGMGKSAHLFLNERRQFKFYQDRDEEKQAGVVGSEIERDGAAIEVRSVISSACRDNIVPYVAEALRQAAFLVDDYGKGDLKISSQAKYELDEESYTNAPEDVMEFGCRPDMDAYALAVKDPECEINDTRRWTGGHIHASAFYGMGKDVEQQAALAIMFDYVVAAPMVALLGERFAEGEAERRTMYGQPGSFRFDAKLSKIEFRTLSGRLLLHPTLLYWAIGAMKMMAQQSNDYKALVKQLNETIPVDVVYDTVMNHNVDQAVEIVSKVFKLLPWYKEEQGALANSLTGSGGGSYNPYFYEQAARVFVEGNAQGIGFADDMQLNWGLYENYEPKHHAYWGIQQATVGLLDETIFPYNAVLSKVWPKELIQKKPIYTHPLNGGDKKYVTSAAAGWLA